MAKAIAMIQNLLLRHHIPKVYNIHITKYKKYHSVRFLTASANCGPSNTYVVVVLVGYFPPNSLENAHTGGQNAKRIFALS